MTVRYIKKYLETESNCPDQQPLTITDKCDQNHIISFFSTGINNVKQSVELNVYIFYRVTDPYSNRQIQIVSLLYICVLLL